LVSRGFDRIDYLEARNADDLQPWTGDRIGRIFAAVFLGRARLIDNVAITSESHVILK
jgi:pantothenate synthetase